MMFVVMGVGGWTRAPIIEGLSALLAVWRVRNMQSGATGLLLQSLPPWIPQVLIPVQQLLRCFTPSQQPRLYHGSQPCKQMPQRKNSTPETRFEPTDSKPSQSVTLYQPNDAPPDRKQQLLDGEAEFVGLVAEQALNQRADASQTFLPP